MEVRGELDVTLGGVLIPDEAAADSCFATLSASLRNLSSSNLVFAEVPAGTAVVAAEVSLGGVLLPVVSDELGAADKILETATLEEVVVVVASSRLNLSSSSFESVRLDTDAALTKIPESAGHSK
jgi:hypothetical protein